MEFSIDPQKPDYQFKIWNLSPSGMGVLAREGSEILKRLKVGDVLTMKYYRSESFEEAEQLKTQIKHITKDHQGRFKGNYLIGLSILEKTG